MSLPATIWTSIAPVILRSEGCGLRPELGSREKTEGTLHLE